jgi:hypothetical protein
VGARHQRCAVEYVSEDRRGIGNYRSPRRAGSQSAGSSTHLQSVLHFRWQKAKRAERALSYTYLRTMREARTHC